MSNIASARFRTALTRTRNATGLILTRRDPALVFGVTTVGYLFLYLYALGHLAPGLGGFDVTVVPNPAEKLLRPALGLFSFTPATRVALGPVTFLFSFNTILGTGVSALVGLNLALTYLAWTQPTACGIGYGRFRSNPETAAPVHGGGEVHADLSGHDSQSVV